MKWETKIIDRDFLLKLTPEWLNYYSECLKSNKASPLCGLPERTVTEICKNISDVGYTIRYKRKITPPTQ